MSELVSALTSTAQQPAGGQVQVGKLVGKEKKMLGGVSILRPKKLLYNITGKKNNAAEP